MQDCCLCLFTKQCLGNKKKNLLCPPLCLWRSLSSSRGCCCLPSRRRCSRCRCCCQSRCCCRPVVVVFAAAAECEGVLPGSFTDRRGLEGWALPPPLLAWGPFSLWSRSPPRHLSRRLRPPRFLCWVPWFSLGSGSA